MKKVAFERSEFEARVLRTQKAMRAHELDALLVTAPANVRYYTGFDTQFWESPTRSWFVVVPAEGPCTAVVPEIGEPLFAESWIRDIRAWPAPRPADDGVSLLAAVIEPLARRQRRVGIEMGRESSLRMPLVDFFALRDRLSGLDLVDGMPCIWEVRGIKSAAEVDYLRQSCLLVSDAFEALPAHARLGLSEREICANLTIDVLRRGAHHVPFLACGSGHGGYAQSIASPGERMLRDGDLLVIDVGATVHGYFSDFDRNYGFGQVPDAALRAHEAVWQATEAGIKAAVPGARCCDLFAAMMRVLEPAGMRRNNVGRMGHGLGLQLTEPPSNKADDTTELRPGMVITIEPGMEYADGKMIVHEENVWITESGPQLLTRRAPREMPVIR
jgi:Xaa-Pro dipeptidase